MEGEVLRRWPAFALEDELSVIELSPLHSVLCETILVQYWPLGINYANFAFQPVVVDKGMNVNKLVVVARP